VRPSLIHCNTGWKKQVEQKKQETGRY